MSEPPKESSDELVFDVKEIVFPFAKPGKKSSVPLRLYNSSPNRITFKVRIADRDLFCARPYIGLINSKESTNIMLWTLHQEEKTETKHYFSFHYKTVAPNATMDSPLWNKGEEGRRIRLPVTFLTEPEEKTAPSKLSSQGAGTSNDELVINPKRIEFPFTPPGRASYVPLRLHNSSPNRITFKVRCTSSDLFRVQPPIAFIDSNGTMNILLWSANSPLHQKQRTEKKHYFAFYHKTAVPSAKMAPPLWKDGLKSAEGLGTCALLIIRIIRVLQVFVDYR
uniref:Major sperm protein n=1 Tax=Caenorhabditis tropicalis TaxID=1561998 RepID=A0A1I7T6H1_9PELO